MRALHHAHSLLLPRLLYQGTNERSYRGNITGYLVLLRGLAIQRSGADPAWVHLNAHVVGEIHVGSFQKGRTVL